MIASLSRRVLALCGLTGILWLLVVVGGRLDGPPGAAGAWASWWLQADPVTALVEAVRLGAVAASLWLGLVTSLDLVATTLRVEVLGTLCSRVVPAVWRNAVLRPVVVATLAAPQALVPLAAVTPAAAAHHAVAGPQVDDPPTIEMTLPSSAPRAPTITMTVHSQPHDPYERAHTAPEPRATGELPSGATSHLHTVRSGDNLWSIAAEHLTAHRDERPTAAEVIPYWRALIEANRDVLPDPDNADLLFPGVELRLPPIS
jgi:hypothetical protein